MKEKNLDQAEIYTATRKTVLKWAAEVVGVVASQLVAVDAIKLLIEELKSTVKRRAQEQLAEVTLQK